MQGQGVLGSIPSAAETWYSPGQAFKPTEWEEELRGLKAHAAVDGLTPKRIPVDISNRTQRTVQEKDLRR